MRVIFSLIGLLLTSCSFQGNLATMDNFCCILVGASEKELIAEMGEPYAICKTKKGVIEYQYIERIKMGKQEIEQRHYFFEVKDGQVVGKRMVRESAPTYQNSYEYQTAQGVSF